MGVKNVRKKIHEDVSLFRGRVPLWKRITLWIVIGVILIDMILTHIIFNRTIKPTQTSGPFAYYRIFPQSDNLPIAIYPFL